MPIRWLKLLLLALAILQSPAARACGVEQLLIGMSCHERDVDAAPHDVAVAHCDAVAESDDADGRPSCSSCQLKPAASAGPEARAHAATVDVPPAPFVCPRPPSIAAAGAISTPLVATAASRRTLPLLI